MSLCGPTPNRNYGDWNTDPDGRQDRNSGEVITGHMTQEEIERQYGKTQRKGKKPKTIDTWSLLCRRKEHGDDQGGPGL
jgi:hypothetical protein